VLGFRFYIFPANLCKAQVIPYYRYICNQCLSPPTSWLRIPLRQGVLDRLYVIFGGFLRIFRFLPPIKLTSTI